MAGDIFHLTAEQTAYRKRREKHDCCRNEAWLSLWTLIYYGQETYHLDTAEQMEKG